MSCMHCKENRKRKMHNEWICKKCRYKWEEKFYGRIEKKNL